MSRTYKVTGVNLKSMSLGESDRLLTILTAELGLMRVVAPGARKPHSKLGGRSGLFVVNELLIAKGRSLDKIAQAETIESYPGLSRDLAKLTSSQYLAEIVLYLALSDQPQEELLWLLCEHLSRLEQALVTDVLACLTQAIFHLLAWAGIAPQVQVCCLTQSLIVPDLNDSEWRIEFNVAAGGITNLAALDTDEKRDWGQRTRPTSYRAAGESSGSYLPISSKRFKTGSRMQLNAVALSLLQQLAQSKRLVLDSSSTDHQEMLPDPKLIASQAAWLSVERALRQYVQYHLDRPIRSATLIDACFSLSNAS